MGREATRVPPLYALGGAGHPDKRPATAHAGLWYDKFCRCVKVVSAGRGEPGKEVDVARLEWIKTVAGSRVGDRAKLEELAGRQRRLVELAGGEIIHIESTGPFVTGLGRQHPVENGFAWHPTLGTPYVPGSGIKGMVRAWAREQGYPDCERAFGTQTRVGEIDILDAIPIAPVRLEADIMTPHYTPYYQHGEAPGDWHSPTPIPFLVVGEKTRMQLGVVRTCRGASDDDGLLHAVTQWIAKAFCELGAGAKTAVGYGRFRTFDGSNVGAEWVEDVRAQRLAALSDDERARIEVQNMREHDAIELVRKATNDEDMGDPAYLDALRQALYERFYDQWSKNGMGKASAKKVKARLRWLRGEPEPDAAALRNDQGKDKARRKKKARRPKRKKTEKQ